MFRRRKLVLFLALCFCWVAVFAGCTKETPDNREDMNGTTTEAESTAC